MKWLIFILLFLEFEATCQDTTKQKKKWELNGYIKDLQLLNFDKDFNELISGNLIHNRINVKWKPTEYLTAAAEFRNRLIWGDEVKSIPHYSQQLSNSNDIVNMSIIWVSKSNYILHTNIERLWGEFRKSTWNLRIGRQRINWGITTTWNPNDIFNTYNFLDVDYEERPGTDAAKFQYLINDFSHVEIAYFPGNKEVKSTGAFKYFLNKKGYDIQFLSGIYQNRFTAGAGWAGSIKDAGFKGEIQYFSPTPDSSGHLNISIEGDYILKKGWFVNLGFLYNNEGISDMITDWKSLNFVLSPLNLMPTKWNFITGAGKELTPLFSGNMSILFSPGTNLLLFLPSLKYNLASNIDLDWVWQSFFSDVEDQFQAINHRTFIRFKWSF